MPKKMSLVEELTYLAWAGTILDIEELLQSHLLDCGAHKAEIIAGRRRYLQERGIEKPLPQLQVDSLVAVREDQLRPAKRPVYGYNNSDRAPYTTVNRVNQRKKRHR